MMKNYTQKTTKRNYGKLGRMMILAMMMLTSGMAWAWAPTSEGTYHLRSTGTGNYFNVFKEDASGNIPTTPTESNQTQLNGFTISSGTYKLVFENTNTIIMNGQIFINAAATANAHLIMELGSGATANPTMKITGVSPQYASGQQAAFHINNIQNTDRTKHTITIQGNDPSTGSTENIDNFVYDFANNFVIDGDGPVLQAVDGNTMAPKAKVTTAGNRKAYGMFRIQQGTLNLKNVTIQNFSTTWGNGGTIQVFVNQSNSAVKVDIDHCFFTSIATMNEPVLKLQTNGQSFTNDNVVFRNAYVKKSKFEKTFGIETPPTTLGAEAAVNRSYGTIRSYGNNKTTLEINQCHLNGNYGCPVRWHGCGTTTPMKVYNCLIENNFTKVETNVNGGGGLLLKGPADIQNCTIRNNRTNGNGGGIYLSTYTDFNGGTRDFIPEHTIMQLDPTTEIHGNIAEGNGGGVAIEAKRMRNPYHTYTYLNNTDGYIYWTADASGQADKPFRVEFQQNGGKVYGNTAQGGYGGGVFINRENQCTYYGVVCKLDYGKIKGNTADNGGGVAIVTTQNYSNPSPFPSNVEPQNVTVEVSGASQNQQMLIQDNTASTNGGGIYVQAYPLTYNNTTSTVTTNVLDYTLIDNNTAATHGGGLFVQSGTVGILKNNENGSHKPTFTQNKATGSNGGGVYLYDGSVNMKGAVIGGSASTDGNTAGTSGGGIYVQTGSVSMLSTAISQNKATNGNGGGIYVNTGDVFINRTEQGGGNTPSQITYNQAHNGGGIYNHAGSILAFGTVGTGEAGHVQISNNQATAGSGGGIYCTGDNTTSSYDIRLRRVDIKSNTATENGGGIYLGEGKISVVNGIIDGNSAEGNGGGVYTHQGNIDINPTGDERNASQITNNTAAINGGGLNTHEGFITVQGNNKDQRVIIKNNTATTGSGGAIFCMGENANAEYITVRHTDLVSNKALNGGATYEDGSTVAAGCGGGIYLQQGKITITDVNIQNNYAKVNGGGINNHSGSIDVNGCYIGSSHSTSGDHYYKADAADGDTDRGNKADNSGGGIYTRLGDIDIEDYVETSGNIFREESKVTFNEAAKNGGGIDTHEGIIYINKEEEDDQIEVAFNKAERGGGLYANAGTIVAYNALIHDNTATLHGGGANNHSGDIIIYGGMLSNNTAKDGHGGGAYTNVGDIDLFQFPSTNLNPNLNHGTKVYNNIAKLNGGAFNNHTGRVDVRHATIYNNTATLGNGGAIFCEGPHSNDNRGLGYTIRLLCSDMVQNKTRGQDGTATDPTGRGGGIYLKYGSIYAHYSNILNNEANINGGGIDNHSGNMLLYGCDVIGNRANEGDGGGIFTYQGDITIGPSTMRDGSNQSKASLVDNNSAHVDGGGINNQDGNININGAQITNNTAHNGNGGGIFITGNIDMKAGRIGENTALKGNSENGGKGGGVYSGGGLFNIHEREENPEPIVLIVDTEVDRNRDNNGNVIPVGEPGAGQNATVHYHLVDQGKYTDATDVAHGIKWGEGSPSTEVVYGSTDPNYGYKQGEPACERIIIKNVDPNKTYYAKAFFRYKTIVDGEEVMKTGYSQTMEFVTFSNTQPLVISGSVSNITKNSAQGSGRVMDNGGSTITERGVQIWTGNTPPANDQGLVQSSETTEFFTVDLTGLTPNTPYHARAYAKNGNNQIAFGNTVDFTTLKNTPDMGDGVVTVTTSIENDVIVARASFTMPTGTTFGNGTNDVKAYGFIWSRDDDPELSTDHTIAGTLTQGTTTFTATYTGVTQGITFYVRAYASTIESGVTPNTDITNYSLSAATQCFSPMLNGSPVVRAIGISGITQNSATITCQIYSGYQAGTTKYGVYVDNLTNTTENIPESGSHYFPYTTAATPDATNSNYYNYTVQLTGLTPGTTYYLKAYGTNATSPSYATENPTVFNYGNGYNFTALPVMQPNVVVEAINYYYDAEDPENTDHTKVDVVCRIVNDGGEAISQNNYGINYGDFQHNAQTGNLEPVADQNSPIKPNVQLTSDEFTITLTGLTPHKNYWVSAFASNTAGVHTCQMVTFTTNYDHPSVAFTNNAISEVGFSILGENSYQYSAKGTYTVRPITNGEPVKTHGVCWSIFRNPTRRNSDVSDSHYAETTEEEGITSQTPKSTTFRPAYPNTKYYVHAYVSTSTPANNELADIVYDPADPNITFVSLPIVLTGGATAITNSSASLTVNINSPDREHHLRKYGVCWTESTTEDPTRAEGYYVENDITAANPTAVSYNLTANVGADEGTSKTYRYRAYCINENSEAQGNIAYGDIKEFTTTQYTITGTANPASAGSVAYTSGLTSGGGWDGNSSFTLTAQAANDNWQFKDWTRDDETPTLTGNPLTQISSATNPDDYDVNPGNHTYLANFKARVSVAANGTGTVVITDPEGTEPYFDLNTSVTVEATPSGSASFLYWTDAAGEIIMDDDGETPEGETYTFILSAPVSLTAHFSVRTISVSAIPAEGGNVSGNGPYNNGESCTVTATANTNDGYVFLYWKEGDNVVSTDAEYTFTVSSDRTLTAYFGRTIAVSANDSEYGNVSGGGNYPVGAECKVEATPAEGYVFSNWTENDVVVVDGENNPVPATYTFTVSGNRTLVANFAQSRGNVTSRPSRPRDIYPAPAREPWDWEDDFVEMVCTPSQQMDSTNSNIADTIVPAQPMRTANENLPSIDHNTAEEGGGIYIANGGKILFSSGSINLNKALVNGGGIYLEQGSIMHMKNICEVNGNHTPDFSLTEDANGNPVIVGGGAGIYLDGKLYLGNKIDDAKGTHRLTVDKNYAMTAFTETAYTQGDYNNSYYLRNNVFLPYTTNKQAPAYFDAYSDYEANASAPTPDNSKTRVIALLSDISNNENESYSHIGFSVTKGKIPVIATAKKANQDLDNLNFLEYGIYEYGNGNQQNTEEWMNTITGRMNSTNAANASIFDDARAYIAIHARQDDDPFRNDFIYLWDCWTTPIVKYDPAHYDMYGHELAQQDDSHYTIDAGTGLWHIKDEKGLAWFSANVNRLNGTKGSYNDDSYASLNAVLEADLDMTEYLWVPIGSVRQVDDNINTIFRDLDDGTDKLGYRGTFNGQGHVIKGIDCRYISSLVKYGLFGNLEEGANVYNTFVDASSFRTNDDNTTYHVGGIAGLVEQGATISTSEARATIDVTHADKTTSYVGGLVGKAEGTTEHPTVIHSSMAMPEIIGTVDYMGGLVGQLGVSGSAKCDLFNSFANPKFPNATTSPYYVMNNGKYIGGLVGENNGTVENCYSRLQGDEPTSDGTNSVFGWFAGTNNTNINYCYAPRVANESGYDYTTFKYKREGTGTITDPDNYGTTLRYSGKYGFKHRDHQMKKGTTTYEGAVEPGKAGANDTLVGGLQFTLNRWVNAKNTTTNTYSTWTRTMASPINDDYPVLMLTKKNDSENFNSVGSKDGIFMVYEDNINDMWAESGKDFKACNTAGSNAAMYLYNTNPNPLNISNNNNVMLAINEDVGILQADETVLKARVGVTIKNARKGNNDFTTDPNWHLFSSAIQNVPMGLDYHTDTTYTNGYVYNSPAGYGGQQYSQDIPNKDEHSQSVWSNRNYFDPPQTTWFQSDNNSTLSYNASRNKIGYFPTNTPYGTWRPGFTGGHTSSAQDGFFDLYCYSEEFYHWINFKREGSSEWKDHWHMDPDDNSDHWRLDYGYDIPNSTGEGSTFNLGNEPYLLTGKGYMMALSSESMMMADGLLNTGDIYAPVTLTDVGIHSPRPWRRYDEPWRTLNMIGNPYQSYLDFYEFVFNTEANNKDLLYNVNGDYCYALRDDKNKENPYVYYTTHQSDNPEYSASRFIHPHQGFFVKVKGSGNIKFNNAMRSSIGYGSTFREEHLNYPLVNLLCFDSEGKRDLTTVELKRPEQGGGLKMTNLNATDGLIGAYMDGNLYQTLFTPEGISTIPIHFKAMEDGFFTLHWNTLHGDFSYLHLIDNLTGADVDCLTTDEYKFEGKVSDYNSRFKLVFDCTGIDEPEAPEPDEGPTVFAFQMGDELIVNGEGMLQLFDLNGRCLMTKQAVGQQSSVSLPQVAAGMYLLRLTGNKQVRVQKMVIK